MRRGWFLRSLALLLAVLALTACAAGEDEDFEVGDLLYVEEDVLLLDDGTEIPDPQAAPDTVPENPARSDFIERIIRLGEQLYLKADGKAQRAHYSGDIYVCKNFTVYLFRQNRDNFRMAAYPDTPLVIPNNLEAKKCKPYYYGFLWEDIPAEQGNPFYAAEQFIYDPAQSKAENLARAEAFMRKVQRGDYFQMSADYDYGVGAHSAIMLGYDPVTDTVRWMDSNMRGKKKNGIRYGIVQFNEEKSVTWWAKAFCHKKRGATIYRLRDDIVYAEGMEP